MSAVNIIQIRHPSGKLFDDYCRFVEDHPDVSYFQSEAFIRFVEDWQQAEWILLLVVRKEGLKDPGARPASYRPGDIFNIPSEKANDKASKTDPGAVIEGGKIAGSLLAVNLQDELPDLIWFRPFAGIFRMLTARTIVYGGPVLGETTRLQKELMIKLLLNALRKKVNSRSLFIQFHNSFDVSNYLPLFREMGYQFFESHLPEPIPDVLTFQRSIQRVSHNDGSTPDSMQEDMVHNDLQVNNMHSILENQTNSHGCFLRINHAIRYSLLNAGYKMFRLFTSTKKS